MCRERGNVANEVQRMWQRCQRGLPRLQRGENRSTRLRRDNCGVFWLTRYFDTFTGTIKHTYLFVS